MSWTPEAIIISGYRVPRNIWQEGFKYCEDNCGKNDKIPKDWEDYFIDMDAPGSNESETFFGSIIYTVPEDGPTKELSSIPTNFHALETQNAFHEIFKNYSSVYNHYIGCRWI